MSFQFILPDNRSFLVKEFADLTSWHLLNAPGNDGLPRPAGPVEIVVPIAGDKQFYRVKFLEN
jgi:hypothetical protein